MSDFSQILTHLERLETILRDDRAAEQEQHTRVLEELRQLRESHRYIRESLAAITEEQIALKTSLEQKIDAVAIECRVLGDAATVARTEAEHAADRAEHAERVVVDVKARLRRAVESAFDTEPPTGMNGSGTAE